MGGEEGMKVMWVPYGIPILFAAAGLVWGPEARRLELVILIGALLVCLALEKIRAEIARTNRESENQSEN
jgi:hypothetical protein